MILFYALMRYRLMISKKSELFDEMTKPTIYGADGCYFHSCEHFILTDSMNKKLTIQLSILLQRRYDIQQAGITFIQCPNVVGVIS